MELSEEAKKEFRDAIRILREDGFHVHRTAEAYAASKAKPRLNPSQKTNPSPERETLPR